MSADTNIPGSGMLKTGIQTARLATGFLPMGGQLTIDPALAVVEGNLDSAEQEKQLRQTFGSLRKNSARSKAFKQKVSKVRGLWWERLGEAIFTGIVGTAGFALGAAIGTAILPFGGTIIGGGIGAIGLGLVANHVYNSVFPKTDQDAVAAVTQIYEAQQQGQGIAPEVVFAALAAKLPDKARNRIENELQRLTGTRDFGEALAQGRTDALQKLMHNLTYDTAIRADTGMNFDPQNTYKSVAEQYAELINTGQLDARDLLFNAQPIPQASAALNPSYFVPPPTPGKSGQGLIRI